MKIILADDNVMYRRAVKSLLIDGGKHEVVTEVSDGDEAVEAVADFKPEVAILDFNLPVLNGIESARRILEQSPRTSVILLTTIQEEGLVLEAVRAGIHGYVLKSHAPQELFHALSVTGDQGVYLSPIVADRLARVYSSEDRRQRLSDQDRQILRLILEGGQITI